MQRGYKRGGQRVDRDLPVVRYRFLVTSETYLPPQYDQELFFDIIFLINLSLLSLLPGRDN